MKVLATMIAIGMCGSVLAEDAPKKNECPLHAQHMAEVERRHDVAAVPHETSVHKFVLTGDGGAIELRATDSSDQKTLTAIRSHLREIAADFQKADFSTPEFIHGRTPAGVPVMIEHKAAIRYRFERLDSGARIAITPSNETALGAIHEFLRFQMHEHGAH